MKEEHDQIEDTLFKRNNVFVITGPLVEVATVHIITFMESSPEIGNFVFLFGNGANHRHFSDFVNCKFIHFKGRSVLARARDLISFKSALHAIIKQRETRLFVGNCCHSATNYAALSVVDFKEKYLLPEGIANYYYAQSSKCSKTTISVAKQLLGLILKLPYKRFNGHLSGSDTGVFRSIYCYDPDGLVSNPGEVKLLCPNAATAGNDISGSVLVLDQPAELFMGRVDAMRARAAMFDYVRGLGISVFYKPHPMMRFKNEVPKDWVVINDTTPAEMLIPQLKVKHCVSFSSSTLHTAKIMFCGLRSTSFGLNLLRDQAARETLLRMFQAKNIEIVRVE